MIRGSEKLRSLLPLVLSTLDIVLRGCFGVLELRDLNHYGVLGGVLELNHYGVKLRKSVGVSN